MPVEKLGTWTYESGGTTDVPSITISGSTGGSTLAFLTGKDDDLDFTVAPLHLAVIDSTANGAAIRHRIFATDTLRETSFHTTPTKTKTDTTYFTYIGGVCFNNDGTKLIMGGTKTDATYKVASFPVSTPWSATSVGTTPNGEYALPSSAGVRSICINPAGDRLYILDGTGTGRIREYSMSVAFDVTTLSETGGIQFVNTAALGIDFNIDGTTLYAARSDGVLEQHTLTVGWDFTTASISLDGSAPSGYPNLDSIAISRDGRTLLVGYSARIWEFQIYEPYNILTYLNILGQVPHTGNNTFVDTFNSDANDICIHKDDSTKFYSVSDIDDVNGFTAPTGLTGDDTYLFGDDSEEYCFLVYEFSGTSVASISDVASATGINSNSGAPINITASDNEALINGVLIDGDSTPIVINSASWQGQVHTHLQSTIGGSGSVGLSGIYRTTAETLGCQFGFDSSDDYIYFVLKLNELSTAVTHEGVSNLNAVVTVTPNATVDTAILGVADLSSITALSADGHFIYSGLTNLPSIASVNANGSKLYAVTNAVEITSYRFQLYTDAEATTPNWLEAVDTGLQVISTDAGFLNITQHVTDNLYFGDYYPVKLRVLLKNTSANTVTDFRPTLSSKISSYGETRFINHLARLQEPFCQRAIESTYIETNANNYVIWAEGISYSESKHVYLGLIRNTNDEFLIVGYTQNTSDILIRKYDEVADTWSNIATQSSGTITEGNIIHVPIYGREVTDDEWFVYGNGLCSITTGTAVTIEHEDANINAYSMPVIVRNTYGLYYIGNGSIRDMNSAYATVDTMFANYTAFNMGFAYSRGSITLNNHDFYLEVSQEAAYGGVYIQWYDFATSTKNYTEVYPANGSVYTVLYRALRDVTQTKAYFLFRRTETSTYDNDAANFLVYEFTLSTKSFTSYGLSKEELTSFCEGLESQEETVLNGTFGGVNCSYALTPFQTAAAKTMFCQYSGLLRGHISETAVVTTFNSTVMPINFINSAAYWGSSPGDRVTQTDATAERTFGGFAVSEIPYFDKVNKYCSVAHLNGVYDGSGNTYPIIGDFTSGKYSKDREATVQRLGTGTYETVNTAVLDYGFADTTIVTSLSPNEEVEVVISIIMDKQTFDTVSEGYRKIEFSFQDEFDTIKDPVSAPFISLFEHNPNIEALVNLNSIHSIAPTGSIDGSFGSMFFNSKCTIVADSILPATFQTVITQIQNEEGVETSSMRVGGPNLPLDIDISTPSQQNYAWASTDYSILLKLRWLVRNDSGGAVIFNPLLENRKDGGAWTEIETISSLDVTGFTNNTYHSCYQGNLNGVNFSTLYSDLNVGRTATPNATAGIFAVQDYLNGDKLLVWEIGLYDVNQGAIDPDFVLAIWNHTTGATITLVHSVLADTLVTNRNSSPSTFDVLAMVNGDIYIVYTDSDTTESGMVKYTESTLIWSEVTGHGWPEQSQATTFFSSIFYFFEYNTELYAVGPTHVDSATDFISVYKFNGSAWALEQSDAYIPASAQMIHSIVHDKTNNTLEYLFSSYTDTHLSPTYAASYDIVAKSFTAPVVAFSTGTIEWSDYAPYSMMNSPASHNANLYVTVGAYKDSFLQQIFTFNASLGTWSLPVNHEQLYMSLSNKVIYWDNITNALIVKGPFRAYRFEYDSVADKYLSQLAFNLPADAYKNDVYQTYHIAPLTIDSDSQPASFFLFGSATDSAGLYDLEGHAQELEFNNQNWTDTTKQLISNNLYTYKAVNGANVTHKPYLENFITLAHNEEVELAFSVQINKTQLDTDGLDAKLEYRLFNQNLTYPIENRLHYPTINYTVYDTHLGGAVNFDSVVTLDATATTFTDTEKLGYAQLDVVCSVGATATKTSGFKLGQASLLVFATSAARATHYTGGVFGRSVFVNLTGAASVEHAGKVILPTNAAIELNPTRDLVGSSDANAVASFDSTGSYSLLATASTAVITELLSDGTFSFSSTVPLLCTALLNANSTIELASIKGTLQVRARFSAEGYQDYTGLSTLECNTSFLAVPRVLRPVSSNMSANALLSADGNRDILPVLSLHSNFALTGNTTSLLESTVDMVVETTLGGSLVWDDNRDIIKFSCYINQVEEFDIPGGIHYTDQFITTYQEFDTDIVSNAEYNLTIAKNHSIQMNICPIVLSSLDLTKEDPYLIDAHINMINAIDLGIMQDIELNTDITTTVLYDMHIKRNVEYNIKLGY